MTSAGNLIVEKTDVFGNTDNYVEVIDPFGSGTIIVPADDDSKLRHLTCGSSRITVINGTNPHKGPFDDFNESMSITGGDGYTSNIMNMGILAEDPFRRRTEQMWEYLGLHKGSKVVPGKTLYRHGKSVTFRATPDGIIEDDPSVVFEYKLRWWSDKDLYGEPMTDQVRESEIDQCQWHLFLSGATTCFLGVWFHPAEDIEWFKIVRDDKRIDELVKVAEAYFAGNIATGTPPPSDESEGCRQYMMRIEERDATRREMLDTEWALATSINDCKLQIKKLKEDQQGYENKLRESMGEIQELFVEGSKSKVTCKAPKGKDTRTLRVTIKD